MASRKRKRRPKPREEFRKAQAATFVFVAVVLAAIAGVATYRTLSRPRLLHGPEILIFSDMDCRDCAQWIAYLEQQGFRTNVRDYPSRSAMDNYLGVPPSLIGSQVALVGGYVIEGHVPAEDIFRLLAQRPDARGLAVPGRPPAAPGMEGMGGQKRPYDVLLFSADGTTRIYSHHEPVPDTVSPVP